jgi:hypothetical protein
VWCANREYAALAFDHDIAGIASRRRDQRDPSATMIHYLVPDEFGAGACFTEAAASEQQPRPPVTLRGELVRTRPGRPMVLYRV